MVSSDISQLIERAKSDSLQALDPDSLQQIRKKYLGKKSDLSRLLQGLKQAPQVQKEQYAKLLNDAKKKMEMAFDAAQMHLEAQAIKQRIGSEYVDVTLPGRYGRGRSHRSVHPLSRSLLRIWKAFSSLGFVLADGPELETSFNNFTALNMPDNHPARSMHDTFYLDGASHVQLRTHTSPVQARYLRQHRERYAHLDVMPDIRIIAPGRAYRVDSDATHSPMFHQLEGLWVGEEVNFAHLKWTIQEFLVRFFESPELKARFRPSFFPFTEPSAEIDVAFLSTQQKGRWLEVGGCGMVHPYVLTAAGIDPERYLGFAFGMGVDRLTMLRYGIDDLRMFYENDLRFLSQFN